MRTGACCGSASPRPVAARGDLLDTFLREHEPVTAADPGPCVTIDTSASVDAALREAMHRLSASGILAAADRRVS